MAGKIGVENTNQIGKVFCGDQAPLDAGFLRYKTLAQLGNDVTYYWQDADRPWANQSRRTVDVKEGWQSYWSLAGKVPCTPSSPNKSASNITNALGAVDGLLYLSGPDNSQTIKGVNKDRAVVGLMQRILTTELDWSKSLQEWNGNSDHRFVDELRRTIERSASLDQMWITPEAFGMPQNFTTMTELFAGDGAKLTDRIPSSYYWFIDRDGQRFQYNGQKGGTVIPKGEILPLELSALGYTIGCTALPYLGETLNLRSRFCSGLPIKILSVNFAWDQAQLLMDGVLNAYLNGAGPRNKRSIPGSRRQIEQYVLEENIPEIVRYWQRKVTTLSYLVHGGNLNPTVNYQIY